MFEELLKQGASPDAKLTDDIQLRNTKLVKGDSLLFLTLKQLQYRYFLKTFAFSEQPNQRGSDGNTLLILYLLLIGGDGSQADDLLLDDLQAMIDAGCDVNAKGSDGSTPLGVAIWAQPAYGTLLLENGADPTIENDRGESPLELLSARLSKEPQNTAKFTAIVEWLDSNGFSNGRSGTQPSSASIAEPR